MDVVNAIEQGDTIKHIAIRRVGSNANNFATGEDAFIAEQTRQTLALAEIQQAEQKVFEELAINTFPGAQVSDAGHLVYSAQPGSGEGANSGDNISLLVAIELIDGTVLQAAGKPLRFRLGYGEILTIIDMGATDMRVGEHRTVIATYSQSFGSRDMGIPMDSILVFKLERLSD